MTSASRNENRLTAQDREDTYRYMSAKVKLWQRQERALGDTSELIAAALHRAIGCTSADLRECELEELEAMAAEILTAASAKRPKQ